MRREGRMPVAALYAARGHAYRTQAVEPRLEQAAEVVEPRLEQAAGDAGSRPVKAGIQPLVIPAKAGIQWFIQ